MLFLYGAFVMAGPDVSHYRQKAFLAAVAMSVAGGYLLLGRLAYFIARPGRPARWSRFYAFVGRKDLPSPPHFDEKWDAGKLPASP